MLFFAVMCLLGVATRAEPSRSAWSPSISQFEGTKRHLRVHDPANGIEEERGLPMPFNFLSLGSGTSKRGSQELENALLNAPELPSNNKRMKTSREGEPSTVLSAASSQELLRRKEDPDTVLIAIKRERPDGNLFKHPHMFEWVKYVESYNRDHPNSAKPLLQRLNYDDSDLLKVMYDSKAEGPRSLSAATIVVNELFESWLATQRQPADIFASFNLDTKKAVSLDDPRLIEWISLVLASHYEHPEFMKMLKNWFIPTPTRPANPAITYLAKDISDYYGEWKASHYESEWSPA